MKSTSKDELKEFMEEYMEQVKKYSIGVAYVDIRKDEDGVCFFDSNLSETVWVAAGNTPQEMIVDAFKDFDDWDDIDREGCWEIQALMKYHPGDYEEPCWLEILLTESKFSQTFEERDKQNEEMESGKPLFDF